MSSYKERSLVKNTWFVRQHPLILTLEISGPDTILGATRVHSNTSDCTIPIPLLKSTYDAYYNVVNFSQGSQWPWITSGYTDYTNELQYIIISLQSSLEMIMLLRNLEKPFSFCLKWHFSWKYAFLLRNFSGDKPIFLLTPRLSRNADESSSYADRFVLGPKSEEKALFYSVAKIKSQQYSLRAFHLLVLTKRGSKTVYTFDKMTCQLKKHG